MECDENVWGKKERGIPNDRFKEVSFDSNKFETHHVMKDTHTGVLYYMVDSNRGIGLTPLIDENGKPLVDKEN